jgi:excinuclease UvrABC nuclease subunit
VARRAARALDGFDGDEPAAALPALRERLRRLACDLRFEDAARLRDRIAALEQVVEALASLRRLRRLRACVLAPARQPGFVRAVFVANGRVVATRSVPRGGGARMEIEAGLAAVAVAEPSLAAEDADALLLIDGFLRRPPPEVAVAPLDPAAILAAVNGVALAA